MKVTEWARGFSLWGLHVLPVSAWAVDATTQAKGEIRVILPLPLNKHVQNSKVKPEKVQPGPGVDSFRGSWL